MLLSQVREATASISRPLKFLGKTARPRATCSTSLASSCHLRAGRSSAHRQALFAQRFVPLHCSAAGAAQQTRPVPGNHRNLQAGTGPGNNKLFAQVQHWDLLYPSVNISPALPHLTHRGKPWQWLRGTQKGRKTGSASAQQKEWEKELNLVRSQTQSRLLKQISATRQLPL